ncbi:HNH endonuclease [Streptomyces bobili]|uniref:HNH endonuclease n=1 Tax=Streptomyces bobili TaxID=67280 RepID=UPI003439B16D
MTRPGRKISRARHRPRRSFRKRAACECAASSGTLLPRSGSRSSTKASASCVASAWWGRTVSRIARAPTYDRWESPHHGPDVEPNILCLCPNCHVRLDIGAVVIDEDWSVIRRVGLFGVDLRPKLHMSDEHTVHPEYIRYHRTHWEQKATDPE